MPGILIILLTQFVGSCSLISSKSDEAHDDHDEDTVFAAIKSQTNPCDHDVAEDSSQASSQSDNTDSSHGEGIISDDAADLVDTASLNIEDETINPHKLTVGSVIQYDDPPLLGVIKWIGRLPTETEAWAGLEMVMQRTWIYMYYNIPSIVAILGFYIAAD